MLKYEKAIIFAMNAHQGQKRKGSSQPYIVHPLTVGMILLDEGCDEEIVIAGILHDTVEDTDTSLQDIENNFNKRISSIVMGVSEPDKSLPWRKRKEHTINYIKKASLDERLVICADKLHNLSSMISEYRNCGEELWKKFNGGREEQKWYYQEIIKSLKYHNEFPGKYNIFYELETYIDKFLRMLN